MINSPPRIKAVIFDMDGTLADSEPLHEKAERLMMDSLGLKVSESEHKSFVGSTDRHMWASLKEKHCLAFSLDELIRMKQKKYLEVLDENVRPMPGVLNLLSDLQGKIPIGLASSATIHEINLVIDSLSIRKYFKAIVSGDEVKNSKPSPDIFLEAARRLEVSPNDCLVVEDSLNGVIAGKLAGMKTLAVPNTRTQHMDFSCADYKITSLEYFEKKFLT